MEKERIVGELSKDYILSLVEEDETIIALDPGDITGIAKLLRVCYITHSAIYTELINELIPQLVGYPGMKIVAEEFVTRPSGFYKTQYAGRVCGIFDYWCCTNRVPLIYQQPQAIKTMIPGAIDLKMAGWEWRTKHEMDAIRHGIYYLLTRNK